MFARRNIDLNIQSFGDNKIHLKRRDAMLARTV